VEALIVAESFYDLLGVGRDATPEEIKRAYRQAAREHHPDANDGDARAEARFKEISVAYEVLSDPEKRRQYDLYGEAAVGGAGADPFGGAGFSDIFDAFFGGSSPFGGGGARRGPTGPPRGADLEQTVDVEFTEAVFGVQKDITVRTAVPCGVCEATGAAPGTTPQSCPECAGTGQVRRVRQSILGQMVTAAPCTRCNGIGQIIPEPCGACDGEGRKVDDRTYTVDVPAGVDTGSTLRLSGRGAVGPRGGAAGDLYVHLRVQPDERFVRDGDDLTAVVTLTPAQAALGTEVAFETLDGIEDLRIPAGTQSGDVLRLRGHGVPHVRGRGRGDLRVRYVVHTPTELSDEEEELYRRLAEVRGDAVSAPRSGVVGRIREAFK
jgi:molecular chaperone DnaJ